MESIYILVDNALDIAALSTWLIFVIVLIGGDFNFSTLFVTLTSLALEIELKSSYLNRADVLFVDIRDF